MNGHPRSLNQVEKNFLVSLNFFFQVSEKSRSRNLGLRTGALKLYRLVNYKFKKQFTIVFLKE